ncbi:hypothetical protein, partial [Devosia sp. 66-22]|uniref:hypothetical protein n=1 Tax=Devosia sp. 66-22 TaxID=1895753 RepID=UPI0026136A52
VRISKRTGLQCRNPAVRDEECCHQHLGTAGTIRLRNRRRDEGRPVDKAHILARRNLKTLLRQNRIPRELLLQPIFQSVMKLVAPSWFGLSAKVERFDQRRMGDAALLAREMVLVWMSAVESGDWNAWYNVFTKVRNAGFG